MRISRWRLNYGCCDCVALIVIRGLISASVDLPASLMQHAQFNICNVRLAFRLVVKQTDLVFSLMYPGWYDADGNTLQQVAGVKTGLCVVQIKKQEQSFTCKLPMLQIIDIDSALMNPDHYTSDHSPFMRIRNLVIRLMGCHCPNIIPS